jgi:putative ABC transport system substrate-binding protein
VVVTDAVTLAALAAKQATTTIPVVAVRVTGPVETGIVASLSRPGGNVTALSNSVPGIEAKYLELLRGVVPALYRVVDLVPAGNPALDASFDRFRSAAEAPVSRPSASTWPQPATWRPPSSLPPSIAHKRCCAAPT